MDIENVERCIGFSLFLEDKSFDVLNTTSGRIYTKEDLQYLMW